MRPSPHPSVARHREYSTSELQPLFPLAVSGPPFRFRLPINASVLLPLSKPVHKGLTITRKDAPRNEEQVKYKKVEKFISVNSNSNKASAGGKSSAGRAEMERITLSGPIH